MDWIYTLLFHTQKSKVQIMLPHYLALGKANNEATTTDPDRAGFEPPAVLSQSISLGNITITKLVMEQLNKEVKLSNMP